MPLQTIPIMLRNQKKTEMAPAPNFNTIPSKTTGTHQTTTVYNESMNKFRKTSQTFTEFDSNYRFSRESSKFGNAFSRRTLGIQSKIDLYKDIALPDAFLNEYYTQVPC